MKVERIHFRTLQTSVSGHFKELRPTGFAKIADGCVYVELGGSIVAFPLDTVESIELVELVPAPPTKKGK